MVEIIQKSGGEEEKYQMRAMNREMSGVTTDRLCWDWYISFNLLILDRALDALCKNIVVGMVSADQIMAWMVRVVRAHPASREGWIG
jgi:hypothetical protein